MSVGEKRSVAVIGGGIIGLAAAAELAADGHHVVLYEKDALHSATSANSHRIIHGGLRYLQSFQFSRIARSLEAKNLCLERYPEHIAPLKCYLPVPERGLKRSFLLGLAGALYGATAPLLGHPPEWTSLVSIEEVKKLSPLFRNLRAKKAFQWTDARILRPEQLAKQIADEFSSHQGEIREHTAVKSIEGGEGGYRLALSDGSTAESDIVVLATGPWHGGLTLPEASVFQPNGWAKAFNLVLETSVVSDEAVGLAGSSGQVLFFAPREEGGCAVGTWYAPFEGDDPRNIEVTEEEVVSALKEVSEALQLREEIALDDVCSIECGVLPMERLKQGRPELYGSEVLEQNGGIISVLSTKYTVFPVIAREVAQRVRLF